MKKTWNTPELNELDIQETACPSWGWNWGWHWGWNWNWGCQTPGQNPDPSDPPVEES